jgi:hypothetical protein
MDDREQYRELIEYLRGLGQTEDDITKILTRVRQYETETQRDSIMDSIGNGTFDIEAFIKSALGEEDAS